MVYGPRQIGKSTTFKLLAQELTNSGEFVAVFVSAKAGAAFPKQIGKAEWAMLESWNKSFEIDLPPELRLAPCERGVDGTQIAGALIDWSAAAPRPLIFFLDDIESL
ncbi:MAG: ATP-binding protein [Chloroflexaceae bacterium]|nr:ATP-binding protein [Chloroflexaceae bacterium]